MSLAFIFIVELLLTLPDITALDARKLRSESKAHGSKVRGADKERIYKDVLLSSPLNPTEEQPGFIGHPSELIDVVHNFDLREDMMKLYKKAFTDHDDVSNNLSNWTLYELTVGNTPGRTFALFDIQNNRTVFICYLLQAASESADSG